jgi:hypothetical protein
MSSWGWALWRSKHVEEHDRILLLNKENCALSWFSNFYSIPWCTVENPSKFDQCLSFSLPTAPNGSDQCHVEGKQCWSKQNTNSVMTLKPWLWRGDSVRSPLGIPKGNFREKQNQTRISMFSLGEATTESDVGGQAIHQEGFWRVGGRGGKVLRGTTSGVVTWTHSVPKCWNTKHRYWWCLKRVLHLQTFNRFSLVYFLLGDSRSLNFVPTFRNTHLHLYRRCPYWKYSETTAHKIQTPGNCPKERIEHVEHNKSFKSRLCLVGILKPILVLYQGESAVKHTRCGRKVMRLATLCTNR